MTMNTQRHGTTHEDNLRRLARIEGQVRGVKRMIEQGAYCVDILTQLQAVRSALGAVSRRILQKHLDNCVADAMQNPSGEDAKQKIEEVTELFRRGCG